MSRISRRHRTQDDLNIKQGLTNPFDYIDNQMKIAWRINDQELDKLCEEASDYELGILMGDEGDHNFSYGRKAIEIINRYIA